MAPGEGRDAEGLAGEGIDLFGHNATGQSMHTNPVEQREGLAQFVHCFSARDAVLSKPEGANEPWISLCKRQVMRHLVIVVVLVARHPTDRCLHPEHLFQILHRTLDIWITGLEHSKLKQSTDAT